MIIDKKDYRFSLLKVANAQVISLKFFKDLIDTKAYQGQRLDNIILNLPEKEEAYMRQKIKEGILLR